MRNKNCCVEKSGRGIWVNVREAMGKVGRRLGTKIHQSWFVVAVCVGVIAGTILGLVCRVAFFGSPLWIMVVMMILVVAYFQPRAFLMVAAVGAGMILAFYKCSSELAGEDYIKQFAGKTVMVSGTIDGDPQTDEKGTKFKLRDLRFGGMGKESLATGEGTTSSEKVENSGGIADEGVLGDVVKGNLYISMSKNEKLAREDRLVLSGKMSDGFGTYAGYMYRPEIVNWSRLSPGDPVLNTRNWFAARVRSVMPETEANLGLSYLLGMKSGLSEELSENLRTVGLTHIVVASGAHLSILVEIAKKIFGKASRFVGVGASLIFIGFFMALVGWTPSIMRAGIMSGLTILAGAVGRKFAAWRIILLVAAVTLLINPMFVSDLGWLLSFASFAGIMILGPMLTRFFYGEKKPKFVANMVLTTLSATVMTLPITLYYFGAVSLISVIPNLLILPTLPYAMGLVFLTGVTAEIPGVGAAVNFLATKMLDFHIGVVGFFGKMKSFLVEIEPEQVWVFALYVVVVVPVAIGLWNRHRRKRKEAQELAEKDVAAEIFVGIPERAVEMEE